MMARGRRTYGRPENQRRYNPPRIATKYVWRPCVPSWEREFTTKIGNIKWPEFVEARKWIHLYDKILEWNDSACEEAFTAAKRRFWDHYHGYESEVGLPDPDMYIDKNIDENQEDEDPLVSISEAEDEIPEPRVMDVPSVVVEKVEATGWDVDDVPKTGDLLTGWIVGEDAPEDDNNVLRDSMNIARELPALRKFRQLY